MIVKPHAASISSQALRNVRERKPIGNRAIELKATASDKQKQRSSPTAG
jgi:hypothetical protein